MDVPLIITLFTALILLVAAIIRFNVHPFLALTVVSLMFGMAAGIPAAQTVEGFLVGFGDTMKWIGVVLVLGTTIGELLNSSGGTLRIADVVLNAVGRKRMPLAMGLTGYIVSIPVFVDVAYIMLKPIVEALAAKSGRNVLVVGLSLAAGLTATHALMPPTPGPLATAAIIGADIGRVILINSFVAVCALTAGLLWATVGCRNVKLDYDRELRDIYASEQPGNDGRDKNVGSGMTAFVPILLPLILIAGAALVSSESTSWAAVMLRFLGMPVVALLLGMFAGTFLLKKGSRSETLHGLVERSIERSAVVLLITGAGGGFGAVIRASGVGDQIATAFAGTSLPGMLLPFLLAVTLTTATGSLTVSMTTTSSVVAPMLGPLGLSPELAVALVGAGSLCIIHANSSFFWLLSRLHQVPPQVLYRTYCVQSLCMGVGGLAGVVILRMCGLR